MKDVITVDGPSGSGKGTISRLLAKRLGYSYLDTGALYRSVAWKIKHNGADPDNEEALKKVLDEIDISFNGEKVFVNGTDVSAAIRTAEIGELSSKVSAIPMVREGLFSIQRDMGLKGKVVIEGRDTGTAIFPESENKFYLDASICYFILFVSCFCYASHINCMCSLFCHSINPLAPGISHANYFLSR